MTESTAARLRREFDDIFARQPETAVRFESFLGLGLRGDPYALPLRRIESLLSERKILPLPTSVAAFAGITAHRGMLVPVFDLGMLLGYGSASALPWLVLVHGSTALVALAFERCDGHFRVPVDDVAAPIVEDRPVIDLPSIVESLCSKGAKYS